MNPKKRRARAHRDAPSYDHLVSPPPPHTSSRRRASSA
jgi:hypothetical protein